MLVMEKNMCLYIFYFTYDLDKQDFLEEKLVTLYAQKVKIK